MRQMHYKRIRIPIFILSILTTAFGIDLITAASLGTSPISSVPLVLSFYFPWTFGQLTFVMNMAFIVLQFLLLRRNFRPLEILQVGINVIFSYALDLYMPLLAGLQHLSLPLQVLFLVLGCAVLGFGICIETASQVLMVPGDGALIRRWSRWLSSFLSSMADWGPCRASASAPSFRPCSSAASSISSTVTSSSSNAWHACLWPMKTGELRRQP